MDGAPSRYSQLSEEQREGIRAAGRKYDASAKGREKRRAKEQRRAYSEAELERRREYQRAYRASAYGQTVSAQRATSPAGRAAAVAKAHRKRAYGPITREDAAAVQRTTICFYCGTGLVHDSRGRRRDPHLVTIDHRVPVSRGGTNARDNLVGACLTCNNRKGARTATEFLAQERRP